MNDPDNDQVTDKTKRWTMLRSLCVNAGNAATPAIVFAAVHQGHKAGQEIA